MECSGPVRGAALREGRWVVSVTLGEGVTLVVLMFVILRFFRFI